MYLVPHVLLSPTAFSETSVALNMTNNKKGGPKLLNWRITLAPPGELEENRWIYHYFVCFIHPFSSTYPYPGCGGAGAYPSYHSATGRYTPLTGRQSDTPLQKETRW